jgi:hypothetical protein
MVTLVTKLLINIGRFSCKVPLVLFDFNQTFPFATDFSKHHYKFSWQFLHWNSSCSMCGYGLSVRHTDMTKLIVTFRKSENSSENVNEKFKLFYYLQEYKE